MKPLGLRVNKLALELHVPATRIGEIVHERRRITESDRRKKKGKRDKGKGKRKKRRALRQAQG